MQPLPIAITGLGLCTALGETRAATWEALLAGKFISDHSRLWDRRRIQELFPWPGALRGKALVHAGWKERELGECALVIGTSKGPIESWLGDLSSPPQAYGLASIAAELAAAFGMGGCRLTLSTACASGLHALVHGAMLMREGCQRVLVVAAESSLHPIFLGSFKRLGVLAPPAIGCRPFDEERAGFLVSEAAAAVCLEAKGEGAAVSIERFALGGDAAHLIRGDPHGKTLRRLLAAVIDHRQVDLVHAHATGTQANDPVELAAIESVTSQSDRPILYSHKGALGHSLGAAGLVAVVLNCLCHERGMAPPNVRTTRPLPMERVKISAARVERPIRRSVAVASGFGGAAAALTLVSA